MASESGSSEGLPEGSMDLEDMLAAIRENAEFRSQNVPFDDESLENTEELFVGWKEFETLFGSTYSEVLNQYVRFLVQAISIRRCPNLQNLVLVCSDESKEASMNFLGSVSWGHLPNLKAVEIRGGMGAEGAECIAKAAEEGHLPKLSSLEFVYAHVADGVVALMRAAKSGHLHNLEHLNLWGEYLTEERSAALGQAIEAGSLERLQSLILFVENYGGALVLARALTSGKVQSLSTLEIMLKGGQAGLTALDGLIVLAGGLEKGSVPSLKRLTLYSSMRMPKGGSEVMAGAMLSGHLSQLETLCLRRFEAGEMLVHALARGEFASLKSLMLPGCSLGEEAATVVAAQLELGRWPSLELLELSSNPLGDGGVAALARGLEGGHVDKLRYLDLRETDVDDEGAMAIGAVFANESIQFPNLEKVDISMNKIGESGAAALVNAYRKNALLTAELKLDWPEGSPWEGNYEGFRKRNLSGLEAAKILREYEEEKVPATMGRVFLCGEPEVGKTTLRKSLEACTSSQSWFLARAQSLCCFRPGQQENKRTRGIEVSCISSPDRDPLTLSVWDLAGQREYHILHAAFFPEAAFVEVQATIFVVLIRDTGPSPTDAQFKSLKYWFKFIASSSLRGIEDSKRRVLVVLNRDGHSTSRNRNQISPKWRDWVDQLRGTFAEFMQIELYSLSFDVRSPDGAKHFGTKLFLEARELLLHKKIPKICAELQRNLQSWGEQHKHFPIVSPDRVETMVMQLMKSEDIQSVDVSTLVHAALRFLNQAGTVIFFAEGALSDGGLAASNLVVADPHWFCGQVVGDLLLPHILWEKGEEVVRKDLLKLDADHYWSIDIEDLGRVYASKGLKLDDKEMKQLVAIFLHVGLCFKLSSSRIFVPALAPKQNDLPSWWSQENPLANERQWVMGLSLVHQDADKTLMPEFVFYKFQVILVQDPAINKSIGLDFHVGPNYLALKVMRLKVFIEFRVGENEKTEGRVDFMVKPLLSTTHISTEAVRRLQMNLAYDLVRRFEDARTNFCPGVRLEIRVMKPWSASDGHREMEQRDVTQPLQKIVDGLFEVEIDSGGEWENNILWDVRGEGVTHEDLLRAEDLSGWVTHLSSKRSEKSQNIEFAREILSDLSGNAELKLGRCASNVGREFRRCTSNVESTTDLRNEKRWSAMENRVGTVEDRVSTLEHEISHLHVVLRELRADLRNLSTEQGEVWLRLNSLEALSYAERDRSIPRFVYCLPNGKGSGSERKWVREFTEVFKSTSTLHFLCESGLHEVDGQEGHDVTHMADWLQKHVAWLKWSICIAGVGVGIGVAAIPGLNVMAPPAIAGAFQAAQTGVSDIETHAKALKDLNLASSSAQNPIAVKGPSKQALQDLFGRVELTPTLIKKKFRLSRALQKKAQKGSIAQARKESQSQVLWVCEKCLHESGFTEI